jgi:hypothetical protein
MIIPYPVLTLVFMASKLYPNAAKAEDAAKCPDFWSGPPAVPARSTAGWLRAGMNATIKNRQRTTGVSQWVNAFGLT